MTNLRRPGALVLAIGMSVPLLTPAALAADITTRTPNIISPVLNAPGVWDLRLSHRMSGSLNAISAMPTFTLDGTMLPWLSLRMAFATKVAAMPPAYLNMGPISGNDDLNLGLREQILREDAGAPLSIALGETLGSAGMTATGLSFTSKSPEAGVDVILGRKLGPVGLVGTVRAVDARYAVFSNRMYEAGSGYYRVGGALGATLAITPYLTLAGDWGKNVLAGDSSAPFYVDNSQSGLGGAPAWSVALQSNIPFSPHQFSIEVSNVPTTTMGGNGTTQLPPTLYVGFGFSIAFSDLPRWQLLLAPTWFAPPKSSEAPEPVAEEAPAAAATESVVAQGGPTVSAAPEKPAPPKEDTALVAKGKKLYESAAGMGCTPCHGPEGKGTDAAPPNRGKSAAEIKAAFGRSSMAMFAGLSEADIKALAAYLKHVAK